MVDNCERVNDNGLRSLCVQGLHQQSFSVLCVRTCKCVTLPWHCLINTVSDTTVPGVTTALLQLQLFPALFSVLIGLVSSKSLSSLLYVLYEPILQLGLTTIDERMNDLVLQLIVLLLMLELLVSFYLFMMDTIIELRYNSTHHQRYLDDVSAY